PVPFKECWQKSREIRQVLQEFTPVVEGASVDEWYLDLTGTEGIYHDEPLAATAQRIRDRVRAATGLTLSIGGGTNKLIAKMAVDRAKPSSGGEGVVIIEHGGEETFMRTCTLAEIPLVGPKFQERLAKRGLVRIEDVLRHDRAALEQWMSKREAAWLWNRVHGTDDNTVAHRVMNKGISRDETFGKDLASDEDIERELLRLVTRAASDMRGDGLTARTIAVRLRDWDFTTRATQRTLPEPVVSDRAILRVARELLAKLRNDRRVPARLVGVRLSHLTKTQDRDQLALLDSSETERDRGLASAIDRVRGKYGPKSIIPGGLAPEPSPGDR
ncbi:MAG TPA: hypothetical protein VMU03_11635, partial [Gammaproteobacteria bacterium]|nr:hypothetical protein [Gammaproteobacteria bacterium]